jgi:hypothetical protein
LERTNCSTLNCWLRILRFNPDEEERDHDELAVAILHGSEGHLRKAFPGGVMS